MQKHTLEKDNFPRKLSGQTQVWPRKRSGDSIPAILRLMLPPCGQCPEKPGSLRGEPVCDHKRNPMLTLSTRICVALFIKISLNRSARWEINFDEETGDGKGWGDGYKHCANGVPIQTRERRGDSVSRLLRPHEHLKGEEDRKQRGVWRKKQSWLLAI